jgi:hypothetical protein
VSDGLKPPEQFRTVGLDLVKYDFLSGAGIPKHLIMESSPSDDNMHAKLSSATESARENVILPATRHVQLSLAAPRRPVCSPGMPRAWPQPGSAATRLGHQGEAEGVCHVLRSALHAKPEHLLLSLDCKDAFDRIASLTSYPGGLGSMTGTSSAA